ncbi:MAG TPA: ABC transporter ATP-binding protein [Candidatus Competibacteraceae bacterium]|nr:ABC transporter ATP-binding protein [Candidatus Competibacteraceae bacterium]MCP5134296.1 ABC transporter ATP-binding protein [Gammaproteobacteria bacterium]HPF58218.1 ABC transporter ATP-binding protein [Candidatus Competibacteraceae bacterium]HRY17116.1 ABC transporter ATP-binding protein [Candidatus Competibacteraceae bacterium]
MHSYGPDFPDEPVLLATGLVKQFAGRRVVDGVDLCCQAGQVLGLLGANGAGKTTTLRMCYGFLQPDAGTIRIAGIDRRADPEAAARQTGVCTQDDTFDTDFTVSGNLKQMSRYFRPRPTAVKARIAALLERFGLDRYAQAKPDVLSGGYRRRLMIARALIHQPKLLFLDEPTTGLDPQARLEVWELIDTLRREGLGIVLTTHYMEEAERLSGELLILREGRVVAAGQSRAVLGDLIGEHMLVLDAHDPAMPAVCAWVRQAGLPEPARVLSNVHLALDGPGLAQFSSQFGDLRFEVRPPTLDDLFLKLAKKP